METRERVSGRRGRLGALFLAAVLVCALLTGFAQAAPAEGGSAILESAAPKPQITIQGNVVVDKGKPTGFYELALCVQTARTVTVKGTDTVVDDSIYADALAAAAEGDEDALKDFFNNYDVKNYPFQSATAAMYINLDALTAVTWGAGKPIYDDWSATGGTSGSYTTDAARDTHYPRGINKNSEEVKDQPQIFTDLDPILNNTGIQQVRVRLDSAKPDEVNNATAFIEKAEFSETDATKRTALLTLSANTTTTANVVYATPTPVVVVRFAYDMERFTKLEVGNPRDLVNEPNESDFWLGLDKNDNDLSDKDLPIHSGKTPLTYLGARDPSGKMYATSDGEVARSSVFQSVLYAQNLADDGVTQQTTRFYYYLGAEAPSYQNTPVTVPVHDEATGKDSAEKLHLPLTEGSAILAPRDDRYATPGDPDAPGATDANGKYSFFQNLLRKADDTLRLDLVNAETYRKPTGGIGGAQILFYDWDDSLIGALVVDPEGDARAAVNEYIEKTLIHPELRTGEIVNSAKDLATLQANPDYLTYQDRVDSLEREYTYRGDYAYKVGQDTDDSLKRPATHAQPGEDYPLTNKLDYAFYRRATTQTEAVDPGTGLLTRYYSTTPLSTGDGSEDYDDYLYPYVHGWAIVEDETQDLSKKNWILRKDSIKTEDVWTTFGVGELADLDPANATAQTIPGTTTNYTYAVTEKDAAWYLRFADFSAMEKMLRPGQDVLIVKAVYEPGTSLLPLTHYTVVEDSLNVERYSYAASTGLSVYSFQYQYQRASDQATGVWQGVKRTREPAVQTGYTYDVNAFDSEFKDLNPTVDTKTFFMKTVSNNNDIMDIDVTASGVLWKIDYKLVDIYGRNVATGVDRSNGGELNLKNNFKYDNEIGYDERQGTDGYVQEATLNTLLKEATKAARNEEDDLLRHFTVDTVTDLNLRADADGTNFNAGDYDLCAIYLQDLVTRLYNDGVSIDPKTGDVKLGWHQIQRHILMCMQANSAVAGIYSGGTLMSETDCAGFPWCRLDDCAAEVKVDIFDLGDIFVAMDKAKDETGDKHPAKDALDDLKNGTPPLLDGYLNKFRKDPDGRPFKTRQEVYDALKTVYDKLAAAGWSQDDMKQVTEEQVQHIIATGSIPTTAPTIYWWWDGGTRPVATWQDWIDAGMLVVTGDVPDALKGMTNANLPDAVQDMISYERPTNSPSNVGWFRKAESDEDDNAFTDVEEFKTAWIQALTVLKDHYDLPKEWNTIPWQEVQYALIEGTYADATTVLSTTNYWWKDGGLPKLTYEKLLDAVSEWRASSYTDSTKLDKLLAKSVNPINNEVYIRRTAAGSGFTGATQFKTALKTAMEVLGYVSNSGNFANPVTGELLKTGGTYALDIYQFQYLLLNASKLVNKPIPSTDAIKDGSSDIKCNYWWIPEPHVPSASQRIGDVMDLLTYAYWAKDGVGGKTPAELGFDPLAQLDAATMERLKLRAEVHGIPYTDETHDDLRQAVLDAITNATSGWPYSIDTFSGQTAADLTKELQNILLGNPYAPASSITTDYWWQGSGFKADTHATLAQAAWIAAVGFDADDDGALETAPDAMDQIVDLDFISRRTIAIQIGLAMRQNADGGAYESIDRFKTSLRDAMKAAADGDATLTYEKVSNMTNYQLQYLLLNKVYKTDDEVKAEVIHGDKDDYWWFTLDAKPDDDEGPKWVPKAPDATEWSNFINAAYEYAINWDDSILLNMTIDQTYLSDTLLLRDESKNELDPGTFFDDSWSEMLYNVMLTLDGFGKGADTSWYEFQYILSHYSAIVTDGEALPDYDTCKKWLENKDNAPWAGEMVGNVKPVFTPPDATEWSNFINAAYEYAINWDDSILLGMTIDQTYLSDTLLLRDESKNELDPGTFFDDSWSEMLYNVMLTLDGFGKGADTSWYEFQYILSHYSAIVTDGEALPDYDTCKKWLETEGNAPWAWKNP